MNASAHADKQVPDGVGERHQAITLEEYDAEDVQSAAQRQLCRARHVGLCLFLIKKLTVTWILQILNGLAIEITMSTTTIEGKTPMAT